MDIFRPINQIDVSKYIIATYHVKSTKCIYDAAWNIALGQSIGNPSVRSVWETDELFEHHACLIIDDGDHIHQHTDGVVRLAFPIANIDIETDGVSQLLCQLMGGQVDIDSILGCRLTQINLPESILKHFKGPKYGLSGLRQLTGVSTGPLLGAIIKPKIGISPNTLLDVVKELVEGGVNFIKEDEIMSNPSHCPLHKRVPLISKYLEDKPVLYSVCINADGVELAKRVSQCINMGAQGVHINVWCGLGAYKVVRDMDYPLYIHFQKSGDKVFTDPSNKFSISWEVICYLASIMGVDTIHTGMWGGYKSDDDVELAHLMKQLQRNNVVPALSCGMQPGLVDAIRERFGDDWMANVGGAIHGHPGGTRSGAKAMKQAITRQHEQEYFQAINKWGEVK